jgi:uncharacterized Rmd1/YagE family protein
MQKRRWQDEAHKEALKKLGEILRLRDVVNLRGSLETPDVYWDLPELEGMYELIHREFELRYYIYIYMSSCVSIRQHVRADTSRVRPQSPRMCVCVCIPRISICLCMYVCVSECVCV